MTKEELLRENQELKDRIIELQSEVIRLKNQLIPGSPGLPEKDVSPFEPYYPNYLPPYTGDDSTGDPLPPPYEITCGRNAMEWDQESLTYV